MGLTKIAYFFTASKPCYATLFFHNINLRVHHVIGNIFDLFTPCPKFFVRNDAKMSQSFGCLPPSPDSETLFSLVNLLRLILLFLFVTLSEANDNVSHDILFMGPHILDDRETLSHAHDVALQSGFHHLSLGDNRAPCSPVSGNSRSALHILIKSFLCILQQ
jgi:hypothetical protein